MIEKVKKYIKEKSLIPEGSKVLLAVSGGKDSVFMFHILNELKKEFGFDIFCAHVNHMLRDKDSERDAEFVSALCRQYNVELFLLKKDVRQYASENGLTEEEAGREIRYDFFGQISEKYNMNLTATAHNFDDQAETVLMNILRGTGIQGLAGIKNSGNIIRPVLCATKEEIIDYLKEKNINYRNDSTNDESVYQRNKIRLELIPYLKENYNENIIVTLNRLSENMRDAYEIVTDYVKTKFSETSAVYKDRVEIDIKKLNGMKKALAAGIIRESFSRLHSLYNLEKKHIDIILELTRAEKTGKTVDLCGNMTAQTVYNKLIIKEKKQAAPEFRYILKPGEKILVKEADTWIKTQLCEDINHINTGSMRIYIDFDKIEGPLIIRNRMKGDKFIPLGMTGKKKLKDFFIDEKIPRDKRDKIPVVQCSKGIIWVAGYRMSEEYKTDKYTKKTLIMEMENVIHG